MVRHMKMAGMLLAITLLSGFVAGCVIIGETSDSQTTSNSEDTDQTTGAENLAGLEPYDLTMAVPIFDTNPADMEAVEDELNKLTQEKINATVTMLPINIGVWGQQMNLMMSGGEKLDVAFSMGAGGMYQSAAATGKLCPLDELLEKYGQGIVEQVGQEYVEGARYNGKIYAVPTNRNFGQAAALFMRKDLVEKHNIDVAAIKTIDDLDNVFKIIKENEPGVVPLAAGLSSPLEFYRTFDRLGDSYGVLPGFDNGMKVENHYERPEYADLLNKVRAWYKAGYINKDAATTQTVPNEFLKAKKAFSYMHNYAPGNIENESRAVGMELVYAQLTPAYTETNHILSGMWSIAQQSEDPERAMMFLNLLYTDKEVLNLFKWGVEGKHYVKVSDNVIDYPTGVTAANVGYSMNTLIIPNHFIGYTMKSEDPNLWQNVKEFNRTTEKSKALGFSYNASALKNETAALSNVVEQYKRVLESGTVDPADKLPEFIDKLKKAGIEKVIAGKQKQLDTWATAPK